jgi:membrane protein DedA with SNARE-associated domain
VVDALLDWLASLPAVPTYGVLMLLSAVENVFPPIPADVAVALGAFLAQRGEADAGLLGALCWAANTISAAGMYAAGRSWGEELFRSRWGRRLVPEPALAGLKDAFARHGVFGVFVSRFLPGVRAAVTPLAGAMGMSPARVLVPAALASAIWYALLVLAGTALGLSWLGVRTLVERTSAGLGLLGGLAAAAFLAWLWRRSRRPA